jgi:hypothetical protein
MQRSEAIKRAFAIPGQCWPRELAAENRALRFCNSLVV